MLVDDRFGIGKPTTSIGLGCGRLVARDGLRESAAIVETALELGIRHFDVAPSYGLGTAEDVLGTVLGTVPDVTICTKVGIARPAYSRRGFLARKVAKSVLPRRARARLARAGAGSGEAGFDFSETAIRASLAESLERLRRDSVDVFLLHQPARSDLGQEVAEILDTLVGEGLASAYGVGIDEASDHWERFGTVWQSRWPGDAVDGYDRDVAYVFHGALRHAGAGLAHGTVQPAEVVRRVARQEPGCVLLVSASSPRRLRELLEDV